MSSERKMKIRIRRRRIARVVMPPRKPKALKREYADDDADDDAYDPAREGEDELKMKITKKPKKSKTTTKKQEPGKDGDEPDAPAKSNAPQKIGFDIATGPIQDEALHAKYNAMSLDELKQYMQARLKFLRRSRRRIDDAIGRTRAFMYIP